MHDYPLNSYRLIDIITNFHLLKILKSEILYLFQFNFVGRILGPRGMTAKQLEVDTNCKIMVRGRGSMRDKQKVRFIQN